ncbi:hypothetical protein ElyMa_004002300 [Elysia marginata]|uniref:Fibrinogen C-terminal domain-containing protein n=1 Tax=Elysia marginata TaxID=1093978 RepID=A0AAV4G1B3_9GAST|nr:hypothetical protein ElyMa_004002300 [Elysia marginata]
MVDLSRQFVTLVLVCSNSTNCKTEKMELEFQHQVQIHIPLTARLTPEMDQTLCIAAVLCIVTYCQGVDISMDRGTNLVPGVRNTCGVLTCIEVINTSVSSTPDKDLESTSISFSSISSMTLFIRDSTGHSDNADGKGDLLLGSISPQAPVLTRVSNGRKVNGLLEAGRAKMRLELVKKEDCQAEFICCVKGLDSQGRDVVGFASLVQQPVLKTDQNQMDTGSLVSTVTTQQLLDSIQQLVNQATSGMEHRMEDKIKSMEDKICSLENRMKNNKSSTEQMIEELQTGLTTRSDTFEKRMEDIIAQLQRDLATRGDFLEHHLEDKLDAFENSIKDIIGFVNETNKVIQLDVRKSRNLIQICNNTKREIIDYLDSVTQRLQGKQKQTMADVCQRFEMTLNNTSNVLTSMGGDLGSLKSYGQINLVGVRNQTETIRDILFSGGVMSSSLQNGTDDTEKDSGPTTCYRGMSNDGTKTYPSYAVMTLKDLKQDILCDTKTDEGGWIVIQVNKIIIFLLNEKKEN